MRAFNNGKNDTGAANISPRSEELADTLPEGALRLLQISDSHLYADTAQRLVGLNTQETFEQVIELAMERALPADAILATGDLVHDASPVGYERARDNLEQFDLPVFCLPGNHDAFRIMSYSMESELVTTQKSVIFNNWLLIFLDSTIVGEAGGELRDEELEFLQQTLAANRRLHCMICLHHHPVKVGSEWIDGMSLKNPQSFFDIVDQHPNIRAILWGHIHQTYEGSYKQIRLMGTPSTCIQFTPNEDNFGIEAVAPGFRWLELYPDGSIHSAVIRLDEIPEGLDLRSGGY